jgi:nitrate/nitrite transporter NarK
MLYLRENTTQYKQEMLGYFAKSDLNIKQLKLDIACFAVWVMFSIIGIPIKGLLSLNNTQFGILVATPILTGSIFR